MTKGNVKKEMKEKMVKLYMKNGTEIFYAVKQYCDCIRRNVNCLESEKYKIKLDKYISFLNDSLHGYFGFKYDKAKVGIYDFTTDIWFFVINPKYLFTLHDAPSQCIAVDLAEEAQAEEAQAEEAFCEFRTFTIFYSDNNNTYETVVDNFNIFDAILCIQKELELKYLVNIRKTLNYYCKDLGVTLNEFSERKSDRLKKCIRDYLRIVQEKRENEEN